MRKEQNLLHNGTVLGAMDKKQRTRYSTVQEKKIGHELSSQEANY